MSNNFKIRVEAKCLGCGKTNNKHHAKGYCKQCYSALWWKKKQSYPQEDLTDSDKRVHYHHNKHQRQKV